MCTYVSSFRSLRLISKLLGVSGTVKSARDSGCALEITDSQPSSVTAKDLRPRFRSAVPLSLRISHASRVLQQNFELTVSRAESVGLRKKCGITKTTDFGGVAHVKASISRSGTRTATLTQLLHPLRQLYVHRAKVDLLLMLKMHFVLKLIDAKMFFFYVFRSTTP